MINEENVIVFDIDGTLCRDKKQNQTYLEVEPKEEILKKLIDYRQKNFYIILYTSRQMRTYQGNLGKINANTAKTLFEWLDKYNIPYDEVHFGKPWCGKNGFYVDDKAIRPTEFLNLSFDEIKELLNQEEGRF